MEKTTLKEEQNNFAIPSNEMKVADIMKLDKKIVTISKNVFKSKTGKKSISYSLSFPLYKNAIILETGIDDDDFVVALVENDFDVEKTSAAEINTPYRFVRGNKGENEYHAVDLFISPNYRPRIFIPSKKMRTLNICEVELKFFDIALKDAEVAKWEEEELQEEK